MHTAYGYDTDIKEQNIVVGLVAKCRMPLSRVTDEVSDTSRPHHASVHFM